MANYALTPKSKSKKKSLKTSDIGKDIRSGFMHTSDMMHGMQKDAMAGYSKDLRSKKKKK